MKINAEEIKAVANLEPLKRYKYLIKKVADNEVFYTLLNSENDYAISELENHFLIPFWSAKEFAESCLIENWKNYKITEIALDDFEEKIIDFLNENNYLMNIFPIENKTGFIVDVNEFVRDLNDELENYN